VLVAYLFAVGITGRLL